MQPKYQSSKYEETQKYPVYKAYKILYQYFSEMGNMTKGWNGVGRGWQWVEWGGKRLGRDGKEIE